MHEPVTPLVAPAYHHRERTDRGFAHTAALAGRHENRDVLREIGRMMVLLDSYRDREQDRRSGRFNALADGSTPSPTAPAAARFFAEAHGRLANVKKLVSSKLSP